jgi:glutathione S-transferase
MSKGPVTIVGSYISPYVRKVLVCLDLKGIDYQIDPIVPFFGNDEFSRISPVRRIPVLIDGAAALCDSTVICEYIDERYPNPPLHPKGAETRARARWLEEFADTRMGEVFIWRFFNQIVIKRFVWGEKSEDAVVKETLEIEIPEVLDYLESELPPDGGFFFGEIGIADIAVATFFRNAAFAGFAIDAGRWPITAAFVGSTLDHPSFAKLRAFEGLSMRTPIAQHRAALAEAGAPLTPGSFATDSPRRGVFSS